MSKIIRIALYTLSTKQGRDGIVKIISIVLCAIFIPAILFSGFTTTYLSMYGGSSTSDDVYSQAVKEVKNELSIENNFEPAILRIVFSKLNNTLDNSKNDIIDVLKRYFVRSEEKERSVKQDDIDSIKEQIEETEKSLDKEISASKKNADLISKLQTELKELNENLTEAQAVFDSEKDIEYYFLQINEIKEVLKSEPFCFENEFIDEIENLALYVGNHISVDLSDITFENEAANEIQKEIVMVAISASDYGIRATANQCEAWVADIYQKVLGTRGYAPSAIMAGRMWSVSTDWSKIQVGAAVYGTASQQYGHVGIYIGKGLVIHNLSGYVKTESLESWVKSYNGKCWGWENAQNLTQNPIFNCVGGMI